MAESAKIFRATTITVNEKYISQFEEGVCIEDSCYIHKIIRKRKNVLDVILCEPQAGDVIAGRVAETTKYLTHLELGPVLLIVPHKQQEQPIKIDDVKKVLMLKVFFEYPEPIIRVYGRFID
ncbi:Hypothetical predicted protein [Paramuricea clavata]|uniref:Uncharacterized protein n=1 Tax=Paramuricea clavata TaxID=317549 RepID=A0A7D9JXL6_PARCT|nr:Hypothetical predicted protein [Paramuricea clavata]